MSDGEIILTRYPLNLAKLYEAACLEREPWQRVSRLVTLYPEMKELDLNPKDYQ